MVFIVCLYFDFLNKMSSKLLSKYFEISKNVVILRSQKTQNLGHWTAAQVVYLKQISGPYRLHLSILSSQTVYTPVQMKNKNTLIDSSFIEVIPQKNKIGEFKLVKSENTNIHVQLFYHITFLFKTQTWRFTFYWILYNTFDILNLWKGTGVCPCIIIHIRTLYNYTLFCN